MDPIEIIEEYYQRGTRVYQVLVGHSKLVAEKAVRIAENIKPTPDLAFIRQAAMLHDIGIYLTDSPGLGCYGKHPYICHGYLGRELLEAHDLPDHGLVCERHVGVGITVGDIDREKLPIPCRDMIPLTIEEQIICYADKFFSKDGNAPREEKTFEAVIRKLKTYGTEQAARFEFWTERFAVK